MQEAGEQEPEADPERDREHGRGPVRDRRDVERDEDEHHRGHHVEQAVCEDRPDDRRPGSRPAAHVPRDHRDACELPDAARQCRVPEEADAEGREDRPAPGPRRRDRLLDHDVPRVRAHDDGEEVDQDRCRDPLPLDGAERALDRARIGAAPHGEPDQDRHRDENEDETSRTAPRQPDPRQSPFMPPP